MTEDRPLRHSDMPGVPWEERMARLHADRVDRARRIQSAADDLATATALEARAERLANLPTPTEAGKCGHGVELCQPFPEGITWAGGVSDCVCCKSVFLYLGFSMASSDGAGHFTSWTRTRDLDLCDGCGGREYELRESR